LRRSAVPHLADRNPAPRRDNAIGVNKVSESKIYSWLLEAVKLESRVYDDLTIHVSEVVGCLRKAFYMRCRLVSIPPSSAILLLGNTVHSALQEVLRREGYLTEFEVNLNVEASRMICLVGRHD